VVLAFFARPFEREAHGRILRVALRSKWLVIGVGELCNAQGVVQLQSDHAEVFERRDLYRSARGEFVSLRQEFDVDLVVVRAQTRLLGRQRRLAGAQGKKPAKKKDNRYTERPARWSRVAEFQVKSPGRATLSKMLIFPQKMLCRQGLAKFVC